MQYFLVTTIFNRMTIPEKGIWHIGCASLIALQG